MTAGEEYAKIRALAAWLGVALERVEQYVAALASWDWQSSIDLRPEPVFARN